MWKAPPHRRKSWNTRGGVGAGIKQGRLAGDLAEHAVTMYRFLSPVPCTLATLLGAVTIFHVREALAKSGIQALQPIFYALSPTKRPALR